MDLPHFPKCMAILTTHPIENYNPHIYMVHLHVVFKFFFSVLSFALLNCLSHEVHSCSNVLKFYHFILYAHNLVHSLTSHCYIVYLAFIAEKSSVSYCLH